MSFEFNPQAALSGAESTIPEPGQSPGGMPPYGYISASDAATWLSTRWNLTPRTTIAEGHVLVASMHADEEGPFIGVKVDPRQDRQWPRTFKYGWPNIIAAPSPVMVAESFAGAWPLTYEQVVPMQIVDWVALECYRLCTLPFDRGVVQESVTGASAKYSGDNDTDPASMLDEIQNGLIMPFQLKQGRRAPFVNFNQI